MKILEVFGEVGNEITVDLVRSFLNENKDQPVEFQISTLGGNLATAITIHNLIKAHPHETIANIVGLTASAGTVIAAGCDKRKISDNALFLIHNGWTSVEGNVFDLQKTAGDLMKNDAIMVKMYREVTGLDEEKIKGLMKASDWLSPYEAKKYGFVDEIYSTGQKIAASLNVAQRGQLSQLLINKLESKMKLFGKEKKDIPVVNILALKDGKNLLMNAEAAATGVELAPIGAATLEDGEFELADGRKIKVEGGVITEVMEVAPDMPDAKADTDTIVAAVAAIVKEEIAKVEASFDAKLAKISSQHKPVKGVVDNGGKKIVADITSRVNQVTAGIREEIVKSRNA
jgi:ATP-dependent protease ClpP protease subunit